MLSKYRITNNIGVGEILILLSMFMYLFLYKPKKAVKNMYELPSSFIFGFCIMSCLGFAYAILFVEQLEAKELSQDALRTAMAYSFVLLNAIVITKLINSNIDLQKYFKLLLAYFNVIIVTVILLNFEEFLVTFSTGIRFFGFAKNPNQIASVAAPILFLIFYLKNSKQISFLYMCGSLFILALIVFTVKSDALNYSYAVCLGLFLLKSFKKLPLPIKIAGITMFLFFISNFFIKLGGVVLEVNSIGNQASVRYTLWNNALVAWQHSVLFGFGPGAFSGLTGPFEGAEAHNSFIDYITNTGLIGLLLIGNLIVVIFKNLKKLKLYNLGFSLLSIIMFSIFHNILRHPFLWLFLFIFYSLKIVNTSNANINHNTSI